MKTLLVSLLFTTSFAQAARFVVEAKQPLTKNEIKAMSGLSVRLFSDVKHPYFSRLYTVSGNLTKEDLIKLKWVKEVENTTELTRLSLEPSSNPDRIVQDELFPYQWSLLNQGQTYVREKDDIHNIPLIGLEGKDISWKSIYNKIPSKRPIVAVLDSGVDLNHPELQGNLWKNDKECGKDDKVDNDNNTLPGDCHGWNFTEDITSPNSKNPGDIEGHGTHVAGIIAAASNGVGIVGVNPNALIMPIKVMRDDRTKQQVAASESFAQGILYAVKMGANIINLSLGWPRALETKHLRQAVSYALEKGVILVAAAGNNNSSEPLYPCAYDGVICAAASTLDGTFAGFSNYGGHVDAITPGEGILSLYPILYDPEFFTVPGYEIKSGTSQSAPVLAGLISILKAKNPELTNDQIYARLYSSPKRADKKKFILGGITTWDSLDQEITTPVVRPILKRVNRLMVIGESREAKLNIPIRNYGIVSGEVQVKVESLSSGIEFPENVTTFLSLQESEVKELTFPVIIKDFNSESSVQIKVTVTRSEGVLSFLHDVPVARDIRAEAAYKKNTFKFADKAFPLGNIVNEKIVSFLSTVEFYGKSSVRQFYIRRILKEEKKLEISLFTRKESMMVEAPRKILLEDPGVLMNFIRLDLNFDGKEDYVVQTFDKEAAAVRFHFLGQDLMPLWASFPNAKVLLDVGIKDIFNLSFTRMDHPSLGKIMIPAFFTEGLLPRLDQKQDFFQRWDVTRENRLYYLDPDVAGKQLRIRSLTTNIWKDEVKKQLNSKWYDTVLVESLLPVSVSDAQKGELRVAMSVGQGTKRQIFIATFETKKALLGKPIPQIVLQTDGVDSLFSISPTGLDVVGDVYLNVYDRSRTKVVTTKNTEQTSQLNYTHVSETDLIAGHIVSFEDKNKRLSIIQTRDELVSLSTIDGKVTKTTRPKLRYSFFSNQVLSEMYHPVIYKRNETQAAALYVDSTAVTANRVYLFEEQNGKLVASIKNSLVVPATCKALNPSFSQESQGHEFVFMCVEDKEWVIRTYLMK